MSEPKLKHYLVYVNPRSFSGERVEVELPNLSVPTSGVVPEGSVEVERFSRNEAVAPDGEVLLGRKRPENFKHLLDRVLSEYRNLVDDSSEYSIEIKFRNYFGYKLIPRPKPFFDDSYEYIKEKYKDRI